MKVVEVEGRTSDDATKKALAELGIRDSSKVNVEEEIVEIGERTCIDLEVVSCGRRAEGVGLRHQRYCRPSGRSHCLCSLGPEGHSIRCVWRRSVGWAIACADISQPSLG